MGAMALTVGLALVATPAEDPMVAMVRNTAYARIQKAQAISADPELVRFTAAKNAEGETPKQIAARDREWQAGRGGLGKALASNACADRLRERTGNDPLIVEAILMDDQGALVCVSAPTSDYWQGDEAKWQTLRVSAAGKPAGENGTR